MGRIKTQLIKRVTHDFIDKYSGQLSANFESNKAVADKYLTNKSKKIRNVIAGYSARIMRRRQGSN